MYLIQLGGRFKLERQSRREAIGREPWDSAVRLEEQEGGKEARIYSDAFGGAKSATSGGSVSKTGVRAVTGERGGTRGHDIGRPYLKGLEPATITPNRLN